MIKGKRKISQRHRIAALLVLQGGLFVALALWTSLSFHLHGLVARQPHPTTLVTQQQHPSHVSNDVDHSIQWEVNRDEKNKVKTQQQQSVRNKTIMMPSVYKPTGNIHSKNELPTWMKNYTRWQQHQIESLKRLDLEEEEEDDEEIPNNHRFLILRCLQHDTNCGGTADRLKPWPLVMRLAAQMQRIVWILWERPCALEAFLVPPLSTNSSRGDFPFYALDWRVIPEVLQQMVNIHVHNNNNNSTEDLPTDWARYFPQIGTSQDIETILNPTIEGKQRNKRFKMWARQDQHPVITMLFQSHDHGSYIYNKYRDQAYFEVLSNGTVITSNPSPSLVVELQPTYEQVFRPCWEMSFQPSPAVQSRVDQSFQDLRLQTDHYVAVHIRALYQQAAGPKKTVFVAKNALHCASQLRLSKHEPILVATDAIQSTLAAIEYAAEHHPTAVVVTPRPLDQSHKQDIAPLHLDRGSTFLSKNASDWTQQADPAPYYDTFVDLYLLANARCIAYHLGNYGKWANLLSSNPSCSINHFKKMCRWKEDY